MNRIERTAVSVLGIVGAAAASIGVGRALESQAQDEIVDSLSGRQNTLVLPTPETSQQRILLAEGNSENVEYDYSRIGKDLWEIHVRVSKLGVNLNNPTALGMYYIFDDQTGGLGPIRLISEQGVFEATHSVEKPLIGVVLNGGGQLECTGQILINTKQNAALNTLVCNP